MRIACPGDLLGREQRRLARILQLRLDVLPELPRALKLAVVHGHADMAHDAAADLAGVAHALDRLHRAARAVKGYECICIKRRIDAVQHPPAPMRCLEILDITSTPEHRNFCPSHRRTSVCREPRSPAMDTIAEMLQKYVPRVTDKFCSLFVPVPSMHRRVERGQIAMPKRATAADVARAVGVSRATVSRAFTPSAYVTEATRKKIEEAAESLGYRRNALARALIKNESDLVAIVTGKVNNMFDAEVFDQLSIQLQENRRWGLLVHAGDEDVGKLLSKALAYPVQAVIVRSGSVNAETIQQCRQVGVPLILTGMEYADFDADSVCCNNTEGARMAVGTLLERGCRRISYVGGPPHLYSELSRHDGFKRTMQESGLQPCSTCTGDFTFESGLELGRQILSGPDRPDGVFCCNDAMAIGVLNAAREFFGLSVPDDVAIVGFDDIPMADWPCFQLTTVRNAVEPTVSAVSRILEYRLGNPGAPPQLTRIQPELIRRRTA